MKQFICECTVTPSKHLEPTHQLGLDRYYAEVTVLVCQVCGQHWLRYFYELEAFTASGRWYLGPISARQLASLTAGTAKSVLESLDWYYVGGSYYQGRTGRSSGEIYLGS